MTEEQQPPEQTGGVSRRDFLAGLGYATGGVVVGIGMGLAIPELGGDDEAARVLTQPAAPATGAPPTTGAPPSAVVPVNVQGFPRLRVAALADLVEHEPVDFAYPTERTPASLVKIGRPAAGGIGPDGDVVAFATDCTHMGCPLRGFYNAEHAIFGPCACHFTTFDLAHRGMVVIGQATENLPQILLDIDGDEIFAVGTLGIAYGFRDNLQDVPLVEGL
jgi:arsenite oxidase small subunit